MAVAEKAKKIRIGSAAKAAFEERKAEAGKEAPIFVEIAGKDWKVQNPLSAQVLFAIGRLTENDEHPAFDEVVNAIAATVEDSTDLAAALNKLDNNVDIQYYLDLLGEITEAVSSRPTDK